MLQSLSTLPEEPLFVQLRHGPGVCRIRSFLQTHHRNCVQKQYLYLPSSVAPVKQSSVTATQKGHSSYPAEKEGNARDCWVSVSNNTQSIFIGTTFASTNINKATNESNRV